MRRIIPLFIMLVVIGAFGWTMLFLYEKSQAKPVVYKTLKPAKANIVKKTVATGAIVPRREIAIKPRVSGVIDVLHVKPGDLVKEGAEIAKIKIIPDIVSLNQAERAVEQARINLKSAEKELSRAEALFAKELISEAERARSQLAYDLAKSELTSAESNLQLIKEGASRGKGKISNIVTSTVAGMVLDAPVKEGESVIESNTFNDGTTIITVADMADMIFQGKVDESEVGRLEEGMELEIKVGALQDEVLKGELEYIAPKGVSQEGTIQFEIRARIVDKGKGAFIRANYSANADIVLERRENVLAIDEKLVQFEEGKPFVEVEVGPQKFEKRFIEVGLSDGVKIEVKGGLDEDTALKDPVAAEGEEKS
jgi:HlyD family secretion protein